MSLCLLRLVGDVIATLSFVFSMRVKKKAPKKKKKKTGFVKLERSNKDSSARFIALVLRVNQTVLVLDTFFLSIFSFFSLSFGKIKGGVSNSFFNSHLWHFHLIMGFVYYCHFEGQNSRYYLYTTSIYPFVSIKSESLLYINALQYHCISFYFFS